MSLPKVTPQHRHVAEDSHRFWRWARGEPEMVQKRRSQTGSWNLSGVLKVPGVVEGFAGFGGKFRMRGFFGVLEVKV